MSMTRFLYLLMDVLQGYPLFSDSLFSFPGEYFVKKKNATVYRERLRFFHYFLMRLFRSA